MQGSKKVPSGRCGQSSSFSCWASDFSFSPALWARARASHLSTIAKKSKLRLAQGKQNLRAACPKGTSEFIFFFFLALYISTTTTTLFALALTIYVHTHDLLHMYLHVFITAFLLTTGSCFSVHPQLMMHVGSLQSMKEAFTKNCLRCRNFPSTCMYIHV